jgi:hypothetical protein
MEPDGTEEHLDHLPLPPSPSDMNKPSANLVPLIVFTIVVSMAGLCIYLGCRKRRKEPMFAKTTEVRESKTSQKRKRKQKLIQQKTPVDI